MIKQEHGMSSGSSKIKNDIMSNYLFMVQHVLIMKFLILLISCSSFVMASNIHDEYISFVSETDTNMTDSDGDEPENFNMRLRSVLQRQDRQNYQEYCCDISCCCITQQTTITHRITIRDYGTMQEHRVGVSSEIIDSYSPFDCVKNCLNFCTYHE